MYNTNNHHYLPLEEDSRTALHFHLFSVHTAPNTQDFCSCQCGRASLWKLPADILRIWVWTSEFGRWLCLYEVFRYVKSTIWHLGSDDKHFCISSPMRPDDHEEWRTLVKSESVLCMCLSCSIQCSELCFEQTGQKKEINATIDLYKTSYKPCLKVANDDEWLNKCRLFQRQKSDFHCEHQ